MVSGDPQREDSSMDNAIPTVDLTSAAKRPREHIAARNRLVVFGAVFVLAVTFAVTHWIASTTSWDSNIRGVGNYFANINFMIIGILVASGAVVGYRLARQWLGYGLMVLLGTAAVVFLEWFAFSVYMNVQSNRMAGAKSVLVGELFREGAGTGILPQMLIDWWPVTVVPAAILLVVVFVLLNRRH
jgi:hypothetical protein